VRVGEQLEDSDFETHYSLGIAYKEMGLYDEAIKSFQVAALSSVRKVDCMTMQGLCLRDQGNFAAAEEAFTRVLKISAAPAELLCARYELAELDQQKGNASEALRLFREVANTDPEYREVKQKIAALDTGSAGGYLSDQLFDLVSDHDD
jgi:tetratricopeptide (TPR) repeat protein